MDGLSSSSSLLTPPQLEKFDRVIKYLALTVPSEWRTFTELDHVLSQGAQMARFPWEWVGQLKSELSATVGDASSSSSSSSSHAYGLQMRLPSIASGQGKEGIALRYHSLQFATTDQLLSGLQSPDYANAAALKKASAGQKRPHSGSSAPSSTAPSSLATVGTNTMFMSQGDAITEHVVKHAIATRQVLPIVNSSGGLAKRFQRNGGGGAGGGGDDDDAGGGGGGGDGMRALDGGRSRLAHWLASQAPVNVLRCIVKTNRGILETSYGGAGLPMAIAEGEEMVMRVQRQDDLLHRELYRGGGGGSAGSDKAAIKSLPQGSRVIFSLLVNDQIPNHDGCGITITPSDLAFTMDGQTADIRWSARKRGSYIIALKMTVVVGGGGGGGAHDDGDDGIGRGSDDPSEYECAVRIGVGEVFTYSHAINKQAPVKADISPLPQAIQPGGVVLYRHDPFPLPLPKEYTLSCFADAALPLAQQSQAYNAKVAKQQQQQQSGGGGVVPTTVTRPPWWWWSDIAPITTALCEPSRPDAEETRQCASNVMSGALLFTNAKDTASGALQVGGGDATKHDPNHTHNHNKGAPQYLDADGNLDPAKVQLRLQEEARAAGERAKARLADKIRNKRRHKELTNKHLLNYGIDLRKPLKGMK